MKLLIFAGTSEGRRLAEILSENHVKATIAVATDYGELVMPELPGINIHKGRLDENGMCEFIRSGGYDTVVDATHPYARIVTKNIKKAAADTGIRYLRLVRNTSVDISDDTDGVYYFSSQESVKEALALTKGNILLTTGSKELSIYKDSPVLSRLYARVLPDVKSLELAEEAGIKGRNIIAMQGPFTAEMNRAVMREYDIKTLVTKETGRSGGLAEKLSAARSLGIQVFIISNEIETGLSFSEVLDELTKISGKKLRGRKEVFISLIGTGMGNESSMTLAAKEAIDSADIVFGSERLVGKLAGGRKGLPYYKSDEILAHLGDYIDDSDKDVIKAAVLYSGDIGIYSGAAGMRDALLTWQEKRGESITVTNIAGISSVSYLASRLSESWEDAHIMSIHGKDYKESEAKIKDAVMNHGRTYILVSGKKDVESICKLVNEMDDGSLAFAAGCNLSADDEKIYYDTDEKLRDGLYTVFIKNNSVKTQSEDKTAVKTKTGIDNKDLCLEKGVPVTKDEVRKIVLGKLGLCRDSVLYDIGAGTGSITVDAGLLAPTAKVYSFEMDKRRTELIQKNVSKAGLTNVKVTLGKAPEVLSRVKAVPTHVFIGGSDGNLSDIIKKLKEKKCPIRVVATAITLETRTELLSFKSKKYVSDFDYIEVNVSRMKPIGRMEMMAAENPVAIVSFTL